MEFPRPRRNAQEIEYDDQGKPLGWPSEIEIQGLTIDTRNFWQRHPSVGITTALVAAAAMGVVGAWGVAEHQRTARASEKAHQETSETMLPGYAEISPVIGDPNSEPPASSPEPDIT